MHEEMKAASARSFVIPQDLLKEFEGDMTIIIGGPTQGIWIPPESLERNAALLKKYSRSFEAVLVPKEFLKGV